MQSIGTKAPGDFFSLMLGNSVMYSKKVNQKRALVAWLCTGFFCQLRGHFIPLVRCRKEGCAQKEPVAGILH